MQLNYLISILKDGAGYAVNVNEIGGVFSGVLFAISNAIGAISGILAPYLVGVLTPKVIFILNHQSIF